MVPLNARDALLRPLTSVTSSEPKEEEPLFLPAGAEKTWYLGFVEQWSDFQELATAFWKSQAFKTAFEEIKGYPIAGPRPPKASLMGDSDGSDRLTDCFQREVLEVVDGICNKLLNTTTLQEADVPERVFLGKASDEDLGNADYSWSPKYVVRAKPVDSDEETRLIGHVEYMGGRPGALTRAIKEVTRNSWGSLRCVLGDISRWMLMDNIRYAFLTTSDEVMFLKFDIITRVENINRAERGETPNVEQLDTTTEPWLYYSDPIKYIDELDEENDTVPVRLALLYLLYTSSTSDWQLPVDIGPALNYAAKTKAGEKYVPPPPDMSL